VIFFCSTNFAQRASVEEAVASEQQDMLFRSLGLPMQSEILDLTYAANDPEAACFSLDTHNRAAHIEGRSVRLSVTEFRVLQYLIAKGGELVSWTELSSHVWGDDGAGAHVTLKVAVRRLQKKLPSCALRTSGDLGVVLAAG